uniref:Vitamin K-dependent protein C n=1 Tax=Xiphophorus maculatus TaxID=8083 RepID=A0A3B5QZJ8_XIPMA
MEATTRSVFGLLLCVALWSAAALSLSVFSDPPSAHMLLRSRRANSFLEELKPPSKERECVEEKCDFEEAREIFQTREATLDFWTVYTDGNQCQSHMCVHGDCVDQHQDYKCLCYHGYEGRYCQYNVTASNCSVDNGDCDHECSESDGGARRSCSCLNGYKLDDDSRKCSPKSTSSCGQILIDRSEYSEPVDGLLPWTLGGEVGKKGENPWQVLVLNARGQFHCGGVLIDENWVLTAAHCLENNFRFSVRLGDYERMRNEGTEVLLRVTKTFKHPKYNSRMVDNDIALMRLQSPAPFSKYIVPACLPGRALAEKVLHLNGTTTVVTGWASRCFPMKSPTTSSVPGSWVRKSTPVRGTAGGRWSLCTGAPGSWSASCRGASAVAWWTSWASTPRCPTTTSGSLRYRRNGTEEFILSNTQPARLLRQTHRNDSVHQR